jgi:hypothetical protein
MKTYYFNYAIEGQKTFLPLFVCIDSTNQFKAYRTAKRYLMSINSGNKITIWFKNFPDAKNSEYGITKVPKDWGK